MDVKAIISGHNCIQLLIDGYRYTRNKDPQGPNAISYFACVNRGCKGTAATVGEISVDNINLKYHNLPNRQHNHPPDEGKNLNAEVLHKFRAAAKSNPDQQPKALHERITVDAPNSVPSPDLDHMRQSLFQVA